MKVFIWKNVDHVSGSYHHEGGVVACAESLEAARHLIKAATEEQTDQPCEALTQAPDVEFDAADGVPAICLLFPDAGCC